MSKIEINQQFIKSIIPDVTDEELLERVDGRAICAYYEAIDYKLDGVDISDKDVAEALSDGHPNPREFMVTFSTLQDELNRHCWNSLMEKVHRNLHDAGVSTSGPQWPQVLNNPTFHKSMQKATSELMTRFKGERGKELARDALRDALLERQKEANG